MRGNIRTIIRELDFTQDEKSIDDNYNLTVEALKNRSYHFENYQKELFSNRGKKRTIYYFPTLSIENIICHYLKNEIDRAFHVQYASRAKIITLLFNTLPSIQNLNDFVIIRADFKDYFNRVRTKFVYEKYIKNSLLTRADKELLEDYIAEFDSCFAGLCLSNELAEIASRDFDRLIKAKLDRFGIFFYERFVDDMIILLNTYIDKSSFLKIIESAIKEVYESCPIELNMVKDKFSFITCRDMQKASVSGQAKTSFSFLGYNFTINYDERNKPVFTFLFGIDVKKRDHYQNVFSEAFLAYKKSGDQELFRQRIKMYSVRSVIARSLGNNRIEWLTNGIISNYNELRYHLDEIDQDTEQFLKEIYHDLLNKYGIKCPPFLKSAAGEASIYNLYSNLQRNRTIIFENRIGVQRKDLVRWLKAIKPDYNDRNKRYYQMVMEYYECLKTNSTIS